MKKSTLIITALVVLLVIIWGAYPRDLNAKTDVVDERPVNMDICVGNNIVECDHGYETITAFVTAYNSTEAQTDSTPFITASMTTVSPQTIACPYKYDFGQRVMIKGDTYVCEDRMSKKYPKRFDIWKETYDEAMEWGIREVEIIILN